MWNKTSLSNLKPPKHSIGKHPIANSPRHANIASHAPLSEWQTLLSEQAGAAATLTGLVFVAVSINLPRILETPGLSGRAAESILHFLQVFFVCTAMLIPRQPMKALASEIFAVAVFSWAMQVTASELLRRASRLVHRSRSGSGHVIRAGLATSDAELALHPHPEIE